MQLIFLQLPPSNNWSFQTSWCPRNPDLLATASFDGKIGIHSLQQTQQDAAQENRPAANAQTDDIFGSLSNYNDVGAPVLSLKQPPKWLRRPVSATFGFGGQLASVSNLDGANGKNQSQVVHLRHIVTEPEVIERAQKLISVQDSQSDLSAFCEDMTKREGDKASVSAGWKALQSLFTTNSREELVSLLGFSKEEIASQVSQAIQKYEAAHANREEDVTAPGTPRDPAVTFAENQATSENDAESANRDQSEAAPSEVSATTDATNATKKTAVTEAETEVTELFGGSDGGMGTPQVDAGAGADFFSSMSSNRTAIPDRMTIPHQEHAKDSSVAATAGSRASSVVSESLKSNTFKIYPTDESEVDRLITRALVVGDFESAVTLSLSADRFADALVLAVRGGPELLARTQQAYFERRTAALPYLRLFQSIVSNDLSDVVQNADLSEWQEIFVVLCTFAKDEEFNSLAEQLGQRIEFQYRLANGTGSAQVSAEKAGEWRKNALLCYLAAGKLDRVVNIWVDEMKEEEEAAVAALSSEGNTAQKSSRYSAHATALQTFMEKIAVFKSATGYIDNDLAQPTRSQLTAESGSRAYALSALYDRYYEYADLLATQGLIHLAVTYIKQTPADYRGSKGADSGFKSARERYLRSAGEVSPAASGSALRPQGLAPAATGRQPSAPAYTTPGPYQTNATAPAPYQATRNPSVSYPTYAPAHATPAAQPTQSAQPPATQAPSGPYAPSYNAAPTGQANYGNYGPGPYGQQSSYQSGPYGQPSAPQVSHAPIAPPPMTRPRGSDSPAPIPAAQRRDIPGWNDAPSIAGLAAQPKRPTSAAGTPKPQPIMSPFPNMPGLQSQQTFASPPPTGPPRRASPAVLAPPPKSAPSRPPPQQAVAGPPPMGNRNPSAHLGYAAGPQTQSHPQPGPPPPGRQAPPPMSQSQRPASHVQGPPPNVIAGPPPRAAAPPGAIAGPPPNAIAGPPPRAGIPAGVVAGPPPLRTMQRAHQNQM
jgi:protein transport protein SEC31